MSNLSTVETNLFHNMGPLLQDTHCPLDGKFTVVGKFQSVRANSLFSEGYKLMIMDFSILPIYVQQASDST